MIQVGQRELPPVYLFAAQLCGAGWFDKTVKVEVTSRAQNYILQYMILQVNLHFQKNNNLLDFLFVRIITMFFIAH